jgi:ribosome-binding protein aMBF1 (putative translation factor)
MASMREHPYALLERQRGLWRDLAQARLAATQRQAAQLREQQQQALAAAAPALGPSYTACELRRRAAWQQQALSRADLAQELAQQVEAALPAQQAQARAQALSHRQALRLLERLRELERRREARREQKTSDEMAQRRPLSVF